MSKKIIIEGEIGWEVTANTVREQLDDANNEDVIVEIASPGGYISEGLVIRNMLKNYPGRVDTHLTGSVASMATYIALVGEHRTAEKNAVFMIHNGWGFAVGDHRDMYKTGKNLEALTNIIGKEYAAKTGTPLVAIRAAMDEETYYYGDEILAAGFVHELVGDTDTDNDKAEALSVAGLMVQNCQEKMINPDVIKKDMTALGAMMKHKTYEREERMKFTIENLMSEAPELLTQIKASGHDEGLAVGIKQERDRVIELLNIDNCDQVAQFKAVAEGVPVEAAYKLFFEAEKDKKAQELAALEKDTPDSVGQAGKATKADESETFMAAVNAFQKENKCTRTEALTTVAIEKPELHAAFLSKGA